MSLVYLRRINEMCVHHIQVCLTIFVFVYVFMFFLFYLLWAVVTVAPEQVGVSLAAITGFPACSCVSLLPPQPGAPLWPNRRSPCRHAANGSSAWGQQSALHDYDLRSALSLASEQKEETLKGELCLCPAVTLWIEIWNGFFFFFFLKLLVYLFTSSIFSSAVFVL